MRIQLLKTKLLLLGILNLIGKRIEDGEMRGEIVKGSKRGYTTM